MYVHALETWAAATEWRAGIDRYLQHISFLNSIKAIYIRVSYILSETEFGQISHLWQFDHIWSCMGLYEVYTEFLIVDKSTEFNGKETERKSWERWFLIYIFPSYFCLAVITHDSVQFHCQFNHLSFPESSSHIPCIIIHSFILLLVDKGPRGVTCCCSEEGGTLYPQSKYQLRLPAP